MLPFLLLIFCVIVDVQSNPVASLTKCSSGSNNCVKNAAKEFYDLLLNPNVEIGAEQMDPLHQKNIEAHLDVLKFKLTNTTSKGFKTCEIQIASYNPEADILQMDFLCREFDIQGQYDIKGHIISVNIEGNGDFGFNCSKYSLNISFNLETTLKDGNNYKNIKSFTYKAEPLDKVHFHFTNLFDGDKETGDNVLQFFNNNWKLVTLAFQDTVFMPNLKRLVKNANKYLKTLPI